MLKCLCKSGKWGEKLKVISAKFSDDMKNFGKHYHDAHQIIYIKKGKIRVKIENKEYEAERGTLIILSRFEQHEIEVKTPQYERYSVIISPETITSDIDEYILSSALTNRFEGFSHIVKVKENEEEVEKFFDKMAEEFLNKEPFYKTKADLLLREFLIALYRDFTNLFIGDVNENTMLVKKIQDKFEKQYMEKMSLSEIGEEYHISSSHLSHIFKEITGYSTIDYLISCRLSAAKRLLSSTDINIKEIIYQCGFSDESNFSRMFKEKVGITPSEFRKRYKKGM